MTLTRLVGQSEYHKWPWLHSCTGAFTGDRWTTDTVGQNHDAHHIYSMHFVSLFCGCEHFIFSAWANAPGNLSLHRQARRKSQFIAQHCNHCEVKLDILFLRAMRDPLNTGVIFGHTLREKITPGSSMILRKSPATERRRARNLQSGIEQYFREIWEISQKLPRFTAQRCDLEPVHERLLMGFILACKESRRLQ